MIDSLQDYHEIIISAGNHDYSTFHYLPERGFRYVDDYYNKDNISIVSWNHIPAYTKAKLKDTILITHARCTIPPHIKEEVDIKRLYENHKEVILGDIHQPLQLSENCRYTSSPSPVSYIKYKPKQYGFIHIDTSDKITRYYLGLPRKERITFSSVEEFLEDMKDLNPKNIYKAVIKDSPENLTKLQKIKRKNIILDPIPVIESDSALETFSDILEDRLSIKELLYTYMKDTHKYSDKIVLAVDRLLTERKSK
jgi:hypothetical protein